MAARPTGTVTFLFTDIEGSTQLWEHQAALMQAAFSRQEAILRGAISAHGGYAYKMIGDAFQAAFQTAPDALQAALAAQRALAAEPWGAIGEVRVRMALHTGVVEERDDDYVGPLLNRVARLLSTGYGGQILLTSTTRELVRVALPLEVTLRDLGEHRLKDLLRPERVFQLVAPDLPERFPPLKSLDRHATNLPLQPTPFIGRQREIAAAKARLSEPEVRLLTLKGPGGTGKTRLSVQVAADLLDAFLDGVWFVELAPITDPALVASTIAQVVGVTERGGRTVVESLKDHLRDKESLLLLDNFEQVVEAAPLVAELLSAAPRLKVLVTSRAALRLYGEQEFPVPPLEMPDPKHLPPLEQLTQFDAVRLFIARSLLVKPDFAVSNQNAPAVAEICYRLDGLPLAIELAAARVKLFPPQAMLARLQHRLQLLTGGARNLPARQQTLRGAIAWSYDLLDEAEKKLFRRMAVFLGGGTLEAIEAVCNAEGDLPDVLDGVSSLADKSLLKQQESEGGEARFWMLETIREYAVERLAESGEEQTIRRHHADFYLALVETGESQMLASHYNVSLERLEAEHDNFRAVLQWSLEQGEAETALRLGGALHPFWGRRGYTLEGRKWLTDALALPRAAERTPARARALFGAASLAWPQGDLEAARMWSAESAAIFREMEDRDGLAVAMGILGVCTYMQGDFEAAGPLLEEAAAISRALDRKENLALSLLALGQMAMAARDYAGARVRLEECLAHARAISNPWFMAQVLNSLGDLARLEGEYTTAEQHYEESLALFREIDPQIVDVPAVLHNLGHVALVRGDYTCARRLFSESLTLHHRLENKAGMAESLAGLAGVLVHGPGETTEEGRQALQAARLFGASNALREAINAPMWPAERADYERNLAAAHAQLDEATWQASWAEGRAMPPEEAVAYALEMGETAG